jgi:hypothetical protein
MRILIRILPFLLLIGCVNHKNDVYVKYPKGAKLTKEIFTDAKQIIIDKENNIRIVVVNISDDWDTYDPHLLFYNSSLKLISSCYYASEKIDSIKNGIIYGILNEQRNRRKIWYRNDLPEGFALLLTKRKGGSSKISNKVIDEVLIANEQITLIVSKAKDIYAGLQWKLSLGRTSTFFDVFTLQDTLTYPLSQFHLDYKEQIISTTSINNRNELILDKMIIPDKQTLNSFYEQIWNEIN